MDIIRALDDPHVFRRVIKNHETWGSWKSFLKALFGLEMTETEAEVFRTCTGRTTVPVAPFSSAYLICGRRSGKSFVLALIACFKAAFEDYSPHLALGEKATIIVVAVDRKQARTIHRYCLAILSNVPALKALIDGETADEIRLTNGVNIEIMTANSKTLRGYAVPVALFDELAFFAVEGAADAAEDMIGSIVPAMKQFTHPMFLGASSPYSRKGPVWQNFKDHHGQDGSDTLVWRAPTWVMNPTISRASLNSDFAKDPQRAAAEFGAEFRSDLESFVDRDVVASAVISDRYEWAPASGTRYFAFADPSGGRGDAMTCAVSHMGKDGRIVLDAVRVKRPPFNPQEAVAEFAALFRTYGVNKVTGDNYGAEWVVQPFKQNGISYEKSDKPRSDIYLNVLPLLNAGKVALLDHKLLIHELCGLERRTSRVGKDTVNHAPGAHDDVCNSACGAILLASNNKPGFVVTPEMLARFNQPATPRGTMTPYEQRRRGGGGVGFNPNDGWSVPIPPHQFTK